MINNLATIRPFRALRYNLSQIDDLAKVIAPPYDVVSPDLKASLYARSPYNIAWLDVTQEESEQPSSERYEKAATDFKKWQQDKILQRDDQPGIYVYEQTFTAPNGQLYTRRGFYCLRRLERFGEGKVFPHERTLAGPKKDRLSLMKVTDSQLSPIFGLFRDESGQSTSLLERAFKSQPLFETCDDNNQTHRMWLVTDPQWIDEMQSTVADSSFLIADGHHRYETALAYRDWRKQTHSEYRKDDNSNYVLMFCEEMNDPGLLVLPTHRLVKNQPLFSAELFLSRLREIFTVQEFRNSGTDQWFATIHDEKQENHSFGIAFHGDPVRYVATIPTKKLKQIPPLKEVSKPLLSLDAAIVHKCFLEAFCGFTEADQENPQFIEYIKSEQDILAKIDQDPAQLAIIMNAAPLPQIRAIAEAGQFMPPKTTYFYPKLPTGLVIHLID